MDGITIARAHHVMIMPASHWPFANHVTPPHGHVMSPNHAYALSTDIEVNVRYNWLDYAHWGSHEVQKQACSTFLIILLLFLHVR